jgi:hypothetical protein
MDRKSEDQQQAGLQTLPELPATPQPNMVQINNIPQMQTDFSLIISEVIRSQVKATSKEEEYDPREDFEWFTSGEANTEPFRKQYVAIWRRNIVANADTALEAERIAKILYGDNCRPAITYIPEDEMAIL